MDIINELWYGNVSPFEQCTRGDKQLKELLKLVARNREELDGTLTDKQKEIRRTMRIREGDPTLTSLTPVTRFLYAIMDISKRFGVDHEA